MPLNAQAKLDAEALTEIGVLAWEATQNVTGLPSTQQSAMVQAITQVMGEAYLEDRARYLEDKPDPVPSPGPGGRGW